MAKKKGTNPKKVVNRGVANYAGGTNPAKPKINEKDKETMMELTKTMKWQSMTLFLAVLGILMSLVGQYQVNKYLQYSAIGCWVAAAVCYYIFAQKRNKVLIESEMRRKKERDKRKSESENSDVNE